MSMYYIHKPRWWGTKRFYDVFIALTVIALVVLAGMELAILCGTSITHGDDDALSKSVNALVGENDSEQGDMEEDEGGGPFADHVPIYDGPFSKPVKIDTNIAGDSSSAISGEQAAEDFLRAYIDPTIAIEYTGYKTLKNGLYGYNFIQCYGPLPIFNAKMQVVCDYWGNPKGVNGKYVIMRGSITSEKGKELEKGQEYGILLGEEGYAKTVIKDGKKYLDRENGKAIKASDITFGLDDFVGPIEWRWQSD
jgi:hypothetical protein